MKRTAEASDTSEGAKEVLRGLLRAAPPWRKLELMDQWNASLRLFVTTELRGRHPGKSEKELRRLPAARLFGSETAERLAKGSLDSE